MRSGGVHIPNVEEHRKIVDALRKAFGDACPRMDINTEYQERPSGEHVIMIVLNTKKEIGDLSDLIEGSPDRERLYDRVRLTSFYAREDLSSPYLILNERTKLNHPLIALDERQHALEAAAGQMDIPGMTVGLRSDMRTIVVDFPDEPAVHAFSRRPQPAEFLGKSTHITVKNSLLAIT